MERNGNLEAQPCWRKPNGHTDTQKEKTPVGSGRFPVVNLGVVGVF
jgi:hypothetical protein